MNKSLIVGLAAGAVLVTAGGAFAGYRMIVPSGAQVISAKELTKTIKTPRQECRDQQVTRAKPVKDRDRLAGTAIGAVVGGLLGNRIGGGSGKVLATVAGAGAGGYAGNKIQQKMQNGNTYTTTEQHCVTAYDTREEPDGYDVMYVLDGKRHHVRMDHDPGKRIPVKDGHIVVDDSDDSQPST